MPDKMSQEKIALLRAYGAEVVDHADRRRPRLARVLLPRRRPAHRGDPRRLPAEPVLQPGQPRVALRDARAPRSGSRPTARSTPSSCGVGTGGTITGVGRYLKEHNPDIHVVGADPEGSIYSGRRGRDPYLVEGIGEDFWPETFDPQVVDRYVARERQGVVPGGAAITREERASSSAARAARAVLAALEVARELDEPHDDRRADCPTPGRSYLSKIYSDAWMPQYGFLDRPEVVRVEEVLAAKDGEVPPLVTVSARDEGAPGDRRCCRSTASRSRRSSASTGRRRRSSSARSASASCWTAIFRDPDALQADVAEVMAPADPDGRVPDDPVEVGVRRAPAPAGGARRRGRPVARGAHPQRPPRVPRPPAEERVARPVRSLGIDVGVDKGLDLVLLDERRVPLLAPSTACARGDRQRRRQTSGPTSSRSTRHRAGRPRGARAAPSASSPARHPVVQHPVGRPRDGRTGSSRGWRSGFEVFRQAEAAGFRTLRRRLAEQDRDGGLPARHGRRAGRRAAAQGRRDEAVARRRAARARACDVDDLRTADRVDAALAALTGPAGPRRERFSARATPREGAIVRAGDLAPGPPVQRGGRRRQPRRSRRSGHATASAATPAAHELVRGSFAHGHDAKRKAMLWRAPAKGPRRSRS